MATTLIPDGTYTHADLIALRDRRPAWSGTVPSSEQQRMTDEMHDFARAALAELEQAQTYMETYTDSKAELVVRVVDGEVDEIVKVE